MSINDTELKEITERLRKLPELEPPSGIPNAVMARIVPAKMSVWQKFFGHLSRPRLIILQPIPVVGSIAVLAAVFWLGMLTGTYRNRVVNPPAGINVVQDEAQEAKASFLLGRSLMAAGLSSEALPLFQKASLFQPSNPEYAYWEGLSYWANGRTEEERSSYLRGIGSNPNTLPILLNLGHNFLEQGELTSALSMYEKVLEVNPGEQAALYNKGLIYHLLQDYQNELAAWKTYLNYYRIGEKSFRALKRLNNLNDFVYRTYQVGHRKIILSQSALLSTQSIDEMKSELEILVTSLRNDEALHLDIVVFSENNTTDAKRKAFSLKKNIVAILGAKEEKRVRLSWFGEKESIENVYGSSQLKESLLLFGSRNIKGREERKI